MARLASNSSSNVIPSSCLAFYVVGTLGLCLEAHIVIFSFSLCVCRRYWDRGGRRQNTDAPLAQAGLKLSIQAKVT